MTLLNNIKKENSKLSQNHFPALRFRKFQMNVDSSGVHILISANFLKKYNHTITVQNGILHLKIKQGLDAPNFHKNSLPLGIDEKLMDFHIRLPDKQHRTLNSVHFHNGILKIHLTKNKKKNHEMTLMKPSLMSNPISAS